jgi:hypothetical protein
MPSTSSACLPVKYHISEKSSLSDHFTIKMISPLIYDRFYPLGQGKSRTTLPNLFYQHERFLVGSSA